MTNSLKLLAIQKKSDVEAALGASLQAARVGMNTEVNDLEDQFDMSTPHTSFKKTTLSFDQLAEHEKKWPEPKVPPKSALLPMFGFGGQSKALAGKQQKSSNLAESANLNSVQKVSPVIKPFG